MTRRQRQQILLAANAALLLGIGLSILWMLQAPQVTPGGPGGRNNPSGHSPGSGFGSDVGPLSRYTLIYARDFTRPVIDVVVKTPPKPKPKPTFKLVGTAMDPGFTYGLFRTQNGETKIVSIGESIEGAEVLEIFKDKAELKFHGEVLTLEVQEEGS
jgi:hypothetical protein